MSEEVKTEDLSKSTEILPAKSEDKLEIEKEEKEAAAAEDEDKKEEDSEEKKTEEAQEAEEEGKKEGDEAATTNTAEEGVGGKEKKKFKIPNVHLKTPKVPEFLRSKSKDRKKEKESAEEAKKEEGAEPAAEGEDKPEGEAVEGEEKKADESAADAGESSTAKNAKARVMEAIEGIHLPKIHKPAFLKKNKKSAATADDQAAEGQEAAEEGEKKEGNEEEKKEGEEDNKTKEEEGETEKKNEEEKGEEAAAAAEDVEAGEEEKKKSGGLLGSLKNIKCQVFGGGKSKAAATKDVTDGDKEESKELLEKKPEGEEGEEKEKEGEDEATTSGEEKKEKGSSLLETIRNVASQVPALFKKDKEKEVDVEAGEKDELLKEKGEAGDDSNKKSTEDIELEGVIVEKKKDPDAASQGSEKKDPEKGECEKAENEFCKRITAAKNECVLQFNQLDQQKKMGVVGIAVGLFLLLLIIIICCATIPSGGSNQAKLVEGGKFVETHSTCGPVQGRVDGPDMFSFIGIPYAVPVIGANRWTHSKHITTLAECHEGTFKAHSQNPTGAASRCWRKYPSGNGQGIENCLTVDIYTPNVAYDSLLPVVVYVDGDDLSEADSEKVQPSSELAKNQSVVFVNVNYRRAIFGFLSLEALARRSYPNTSGNYGLGDIISALHWIKLNINHFGGHPSKVTLVGRGSGATMVTALTASPKAKDLFKRVWVSNGAGLFEEKTLEQANKENKVIVEALNCGSDVAECLVDAAAEDLTRVIPYDWQDTKQRELPQVGERGHSWLVVDKHLLLENPKTYWETNKLSNNIPIVFGATAQGDVTTDNKEFMDWTNTDKYAAHVEGKLGSFNNTIPAQAMALYNFLEEGKETRNHWLEYASMLSDIRTVCPLQHLAGFVSSNFVANVYSYVATQKRSSGLGGLADATADLAAIFGAFSPANEDESKFVANMQSMFYTFVRDGTLPNGNADLTRGLYVVDKDIATQNSYPTCDFWKRAHDIVPNYGNMD